MIFYLRRFSLTLVVLIVSIVWGTHLAIGIAGVATALFLDVFVSSRSKDLLLYRDDLDFSAPAQLVSWREALRLHSAAIVAGPLVALTPRAFDGGATVQQIFSMAALLICGSVASYCGLFFIGSQVPRDINYRARTMTGEAGLYLGIDFLPPYPRALMAGLLRILFGPFLMSIFLMLLAGLQTDPTDLKLSLLLVGAAWLFQLGFLLLFQGLLTLRWLSRPSLEAS